MNSNKMTKLKILPVNKTVVFNSPIEGDDVLVRTGTISEGSSFFHSLLHSYSNEYTSMNKKDRMKFVHRLRASMAGKVDIESWEEMGGGLISKIPFQELIHTVLCSFNSFLANQETKVRGRATRKIIKLLINDPKDLEVYQLILDIVSVEELEKNILSKAYEKSDGKSIKETIAIIIEELLSHLKTLPELNSIETSKKDRLTNVFVIFMKVACNESHKEAYKKYVKGLETTKENVDDYTLDFISNRFNRDIYFINSESRLPYTDFLSGSHLKQRKSIIVICVNKKHYEVVGRLLPGNRIQREFDYSDPLIKKIYMFLLHPERISSNYPELKHYIRAYQESPIRKNKNYHSEDEYSDSISDFNSECNSESDVYYDSSDNSGSESE